jgi:hypothetical protein
MKKWRLVLGVVLVLVLGILAGSAGTRLYFARTYHFPPDRKARMALFEQRLSRELALTPAQKAAIEQILDRTTEKLRAHYSRLRPEAERIIKEGFSEIQAQLNEEQRKKFDVLKEQFRHRRHLRQGGPGAWCAPGGPGG